VLNALAKNSGGRFFDDPDELNQFLSSLKFRGKEEEAVRYFSLWQIFTVISCLLGLLVVEWTIRKFRNMP